MNKLAQLISSGEITVEELASASDLIERANFIVEGINACKKTIQFPLGITQLDCYRYTDHAGEYEAWGHCDTNGVFTCFSNWGGSHVVGHAKLTDFQDVFMAFEEDELRQNLTIFFKQQIAKKDEK